MRSLNYFVTSSVWLHLEAFHNAGLTSEETKEVIEKMRDPASSSLFLSCRTSGLNGNWIVSTGLLHPTSIENLVCEIHRRLETALEKKTGKPKEHMTIWAVQCNP